MAPAEYSLPGPLAPARVCPGLGRRRPAPSIVDPGESRKGLRPWRRLGGYVPADVAPDDDRTDDE